MVEGWACWNFTLNWIKEAWTTGEPRSLHAYGAELEAEGFGIGLSRISFCILDNFAIDARSLHFNGKWCVFIYRWRKKIFFCYLKNRHPSRGMAKIAVVFVVSILFPIYCTVPNCGSHIANARYRLKESDYDCLQAFSLNKTRGIECFGFLCFPSTG